MAFVPKDRREKLHGQAQWNGIDFVEVVGSAQTELRVHFLNVAPALAGHVSKAEITGGETIPSVKVKDITAADWSVDADGRPLLKLSVAAPGDFSTYTLTLTSDRLDPYFAKTQFSFKAGCPSTLDCPVPPPACPPPDGDTPPIDYLAKDFLSFRQALLDFSALRYPEWRERSEADFGMMQLEALCALADDFSYTQDRHWADAALETATQRRAAVRHARLVDYEPRPVVAPRVLLQFEVTGGPLPTGLSVSAQRPDGTPIDFETGTGLIDPTTGELDRTTFATSPSWNRGQIKPYFWDDGDECLRAGATELWVEDWGFGFFDGQLLLLDTAAPVAADPPLREVVRLLPAQETTDPLYAKNVTRLTWRPEDAPRADHDLTRTEVVGNLVPATQGRRYTEAFAIGKSPAANPQLPVAVTRTGPNGSVQYLYTLRQAPLAWLDPLSGDGLPLPEIELLEQPALPGDTATPWRWRRTLLEVDGFAPAFTLDAARYRPTNVRTAAGRPIEDYDGDLGDTLRFGDAVFGRVPDEGAVYRVTYRVCAGTAAEVAADTITRVAASALAVAVTNPFAATGGADPEPLEDVRPLAPQAFRAKQFRAVRAEDYEKAAQTLPWVQRAGTTFRWTGSWLTVFTSVNPKGAMTIPVARHAELIDLLNRYRLAGYESYAPAPRYVALDLKVHVCARSDAFRGDVEAAVCAALSADALPGGGIGFFHVDNFTFGTPLERSALEAAIQAAPGVGGVISIEYRRRGTQTDFSELPETVTPGDHAILVVANDPSRPDAGSVRVYVEGGK